MTRGMSSNMATEPGSNPDSQDRTEPPLVEGSPSRDNSEPRSVSPESPDTPETPDTPDTPNTPETATADSSAADSAGDDKDWFAHYAKAKQAEQSGQTDTHSEPVEAQEAAPSTAEERDSTPRQRTPAERQTTAQKVPNPENDPQIQQLNKALHDANTARAAQSALQRRYNDLEQKYQTLYQQVQAQQSGTASRKAESSDSSDAKTAPVNLDEFRQEYPEIAQALDAQLQQQQARYEQAIAQLQQQMQAVAQPLSHLEQERSQQRVQSELEKLAQAHPDYAAIQQSEQFWSWLDQQSEGIRNLVQHSQSADDNIAVLNLYKQQTQQQTQAQPQATSSKTASPQATRPAPLPRSPATAEVPQGKRGSADYRDEVPEGSDLFDYWAKRANARLKAQFG